MWRVTRIAKICGVSFITFSLRAIAFQYILHSEMCVKVVFTSEEMHTYMLILKSLIHIHEKLYIQYWMYPSQRHLSSEYALLTFQGNGIQRYYQRWSIRWWSHFSKCLWLNCIATAGMQECTLNAFSKWPCQTQSDCIFSPWTFDQMLMITCWFCQKLHPGMNGVPAAARSWYRKFPSQKITYH